MTFDQASLDAVVHLFLTEGAIPDSDVMLKVRTTIADRENGFRQVGVIRNGNPVERSCVLPRHASR